MDKSRRADDVVYGTRDLLFFGVTDMPSLRDWTGAVRTGGVVPWGRDISGPHYFSIAVSSNSTSFAISNLRSSSSYFMSV
jgi:hypothetical protein